MSFDNLIQTSKDNINSSHYVTVLPDLVAYMLIKNMKCIQIDRSTFTKDLTPIFPGTATYKLSQFSCEIRTMESIVSPCKNEKDRVKIEWEDIVQIAKPYVNTRAVACNVYNLIRFANINKIELRKLV